MVVMGAIYCKYKSLYHSIMAQIKKRKRENGETIDNDGNDEDAKSTTKALLTQFENWINDMQDNNTLANNNDSNGKNENSENNGNNGNNDNSDNNENGNNDEMNKQDFEKMNDCEKEKYYIEKAYQLSNAKCGQICALYGFLLCYRSNGDEKCKEKGMQLFKQSLEFGYRENVIGNLADKITSIDNNYDEAFEWIEKGYKYIENNGLSNICGVYLNRMHGILLIDKLHILNDETEKEKTIDLALSKFKKAVDLDNKIWGQWIGRDTYAYTWYADQLSKYKKDYKNGKKYYEIAIKIDQCLFWYIKDYWMKNDETIENIYIPNDIWNMIVMYWYIPQNSNIVSDYADLVKNHFEYGKKKSNMYRSLSRVTDSSRVFLVKGIDQGRKAWYYVLVEMGKVEGFLKALNDDIIHLENYGTILHSAYGDEPPQSITDQLREKYGMD